MSNNITRFIVVPMEIRACSECPHYWHGCGIGATDKEKYTPFYNDCPLEHFDKEKGNEKI